MGQCYNSTVVACDIDRVWQTIRNFHDMSWGLPVITNVDTVGVHAGDEVGASRILNDAFHETLQILDDENFTFSYSIDDGPTPIAKDSVKNYIGTVKLMPVTDRGHTFVQWTSTFEHEDSSAVVEFCDPIYQALLAALKAYLEEDI